MMYLWAAVAVLGGALLAMVGCIFMLHRRLREQARITAALQKIVRQQSQLQAKNPALAQIEELRMANQAVTRRLSQFEQQLQELSQQQHAIEHIEPERKIYSRATKMVELGADIQEIMRECELPRAEAELLLRLHGKPS